MQKLHIATPCHEDWAKMQPTANGAFCQSCQKEVIDFTTMDDTAVQNFLIQNAGKKICGRASSKQLQQFNIVINEQIFSTNISQWKKYLAVLLICFGSLISCTNNVELGRTMGKLKVDTIDSIKTTQLGYDTVTITPPLLVVMGEVPPLPYPPTEYNTITTTITQGVMEVPDVLEITEPPIEALHLIEVKDTLPKGDSLPLKGKVKDSCGTVIFS